MARGRKAAVNESAARMIETLQFVKIAVKSDADLYGRNVQLTNGWAFTHNGVIAAGMSLGGNEVAGYVDFAQLMGALNNVGKELTISSGEDGIEIKSGDYEVMVPMQDTELIRSAPPDQAPQGGQPYPVGDEFRAALEVASRVVSDTAENVRDAAIYNNGTALIATDGKAVVEAWHGHNLPLGLVFPKAFAVAVNKTDKKITGFTFDAAGYKSFTLWFEDQSFIRTNLFPYADYPQDVIQKYPSLFANMEKLIEVPKGFFEAVDAVSPFGEGTGIVCLTGGAVCTDYREGQGWFSHKLVKGLPEGLWVSGPRVASFRDATKFYTGDPSSPIMLFAGMNGWRAALAAIERPIPQAGSSIAPPAVTAPDPATAPAWGAPAPAPSGETAPPAPPAAAPAPGPAPQAITLPWTPFERQTSMVGAPGWDTTPYTLQPGEKVTDFVNPKDNEARAMYGWPPNPEVPTQAVATGAPANPQPASAPAFAPVPATPAAPAPTQPETATFPSEATGGFTPFQPAQDGVPTFTPPVPTSAPAAPAPAAPAPAFPSETPHQIDTGGGHGNQFGQAPGPASPSEQAPAFAAPTGGAVPPWAVPGNSN